MNGTRIVALIIGAGIIFPLELWLEAPWYVAVPLGILGYLLARYAGGAIQERRRVRRDAEEAAERLRISSSTPTTAAEGE
jgi:hypothetical protein